MGLTERHWFEDEEPELTENQIEDMLWERDKAYQAGYKKGLSDGSITASQAQENNILNKMWNALYAEEDRLEKKFIGTDKHDDWFTVYRPWLQNGFEIGLKVIAGIYEQKGEPNDAR